MRVVGEVSVWVILSTVFVTALDAMLAQQVLVGVHRAQVVVWFLAGARAFFGIIGLRPKGPGFRPRAVRTTPECVRCSHSLFTSR